jgi:hypothetical protein
MLHMYALVRHPAALPDVRGIDDEPLRTSAAADGIDAVVSETRHGPGAPSEAAILAHARVVEAVAAVNDSVLPARFSAGVAGEDELRQQLAGRRDQILQALERVAGCVEIGLRVLPEGRDDPAQAASGSEYMRRRLDEITGAEKLAQNLHEELASAARESSCNVLARRDVVLTGAYLVARADLDDFHATLREAERNVAGVTLVTTGPWPPYSFALIEADGT